MPFTRRPLPRVAPGLPITSGAWNAVVGAIEGGYDALVVERPYLEAAVTWRGRPVREADVTGTPLDSTGDPAGPALRAYPPHGELTVHQVVGVTPGRWSVHVEAPGFAPADVALDALPATGGGPLASTQLELTAVAVPAPDLVGLSYFNAGSVLTWARLGATLGQSTLDSLGGAPIDNGGSVALLQWPRDTMIDRTTNVYVLYSPGSTGRPAWRAVVPDLLGTVATNLQGILDGFNLTPGRQDGLESGPTDSIRVVSQAPAPGRLVAAGTAVDVRFGDGNLASATFGAYEGTHRALANRRLSEVRDHLRSVVNTLPEGEFINSPLDGQKTGCTPWEIARTYYSDADLKVVVDFFHDGFGVQVGDQPGEDLAALWSSFVVTVAP